MQQRLMMREETKHTTTPLDGFCVCDLQGLLGTAKTVGYEKDIACRIASSYYGTETGQRVENNYITLRRICAKIPKYLKVHLGVRHLLKSPSDKKNRKGIEKVFAAICDVLAVEGIYLLRSEEELRHMVAISFPKNQLTRILQSEPPEVLRHYLNISKLNRGTSIKEELQLRELSPFY